jgi:membrane protein implicated in regulation of membrane protease activity
MGIALILLGLLAAGLVVDFAAENWSAGTAEQTFALFGGSFTLTGMQIVLAAAVLGAAAVVCCVLGTRLLRGSRGRRLSTKRRIADLEGENAALKRELAAEPQEEVRIGEHRSAVESRS